MISKLSIKYKITNQLIMFNNILIKNIINKHPVGATIFMAIICDKLKLVLSETLLTASDDKDDDFFLCITNLGNIENIEVADPIIK